MSNIQYTSEGPNPSGTCQCGCGHITPTAKRSYKYRGVRIGQHFRFCAGHKLPPPVIPREEDRGFVTPCWIPNRRDAAGGYRRNMVRRNAGPIHKRFYEERFGPIPDGMVIDHLCRQRDCCNPDHLEPVTNAANIQRGNSAKLTPDQVREIRAIPRNVSHRPIAERYCVSIATISMVRSHKAWRD